MDFELIIEIAVIVTVSVIAIIVIDDKARHALLVAAASTKYSIFSFLFKQKESVDAMQQLRNYVAHLEAKVLEMRRHTNQLRGQRHVLKETIVTNEKEMTTLLQEASVEKGKDNPNFAVFRLRKVARLEESNKRLDELYNRMSQLYQHLNRMYDASKIVLEDVKDQISIQETEQKAITAGHSAVQSAVSVLNTETQENKMYNQSIDAVNIDVANRIGEMEEFLRLSSGMMKSIDMKNSVMEEDGLKLLGDWELKMKQADLLVSAMDKKTIPAGSEPAKNIEQKSAYDSFFE